jgi:hypothetical protein
MLCMRCKVDFAKLYFVSKEDAAGTKIEGPLVCLRCYSETFPNRTLPMPAYEVRPESPKLVRRLSFDATEPSPIDKAFVASPGQTRTLSVDEALQCIANENRTSRVGFTWGPQKFNQAWLDSINRNEVIDYSLSIPKECAQGLGVYLAANIFGSCSYGNTEDTSILMVTCVNTPTLDYSSSKKKTELANEVARRTNVRMTGPELDAHLNAKACRVCAIKIYGNYFALTTGENVTPTFDIANSVSQAHVKIVAASSYPHAKAYLHKLGLLQG